MSTRMQTRNGRLAAAAIRTGCLATLCALAVLGSACEQPGPVAGGSVAVLPGATLWVTPAAQRMVVGSEQEFTATRSDERESGRRNATEPRSELIWSIDDEAVATLAVRPDGVAVVTALAPGWLTVTAASGELSGSATVQVAAR